MGLAWKSLWLREIQYTPFCPRVHDVNSSQPLGKKPTGLVWLYVLNDVITIDEGCTRQAQRLRRLMCLRKSVVMYVKVLVYK